jgi:hypothetical protein
MVFTMALDHPSILFTKPFVNPKHTLCDVLVNVSHECTSSERHRFAVEGR